MMNKCKDKDFKNQQVQSLTALLKKHIAVLPRIYFAQKIAASKLCVKPPGAFLVHDQL